MAQWSRDEPDAEVTAAHEIEAMAQTYSLHVHDELRGRQYGCTSENIRYRREWGALTKLDRLDYIDAVQCLMRLPPKSNPKVVPGARSRFDDFSATHIMMTPFVHFSGLFLAFHRYIVWVYENALRDECGYNGTQPYWDWTLSWQNLSDSTVFDGSEYSMGGNGEYIPGRVGTNISAFGLDLTIPPGIGGGCITSGPFTTDKYNVSLGPIAFAPYGPDSGLGYNPRCLARDFAFRWSNNTRPSKVLELLTQCEDVGCFDELFESIEGCHAGGHFSLGGLGLDAYASAGDPVFWLHHSQVDRMWSYWQAQNPANRTFQTAETGTAFNEPPSANVTLETPISIGILDKERPYIDFVSPLDGPLCYAYI